jgi:hypothetical protein
VAFATEISLAKARKDDSRIQLKNKEELLYALTDREALYKILDQGEEAFQESECLRGYSEEDKDYTVKYFMRIRDKANPEELRFY